jgi:hypothetical protein
MKHLSDIDYGLQIHNLVGPSFARVVKTSFSVILAISFLVSFADSQDGSSVSQIVTVEVKPITKIAVSGNPGALIITEAVAGENLSAVEDENTRYSVTTNLDNMKIVASINDPMPSGTKLLINLQSSRGYSVGTVDISHALSSVNVVTGLSRNSDRDQTIKYTFAADANVAEIPMQSRTVTLTLTD